jgi:predicted phosphate transport protein (TIGR00153 family)
MAKGDKFYFENFSECAELAKSAANYLVECLESYDADKIEEMLEKMHGFEHTADGKKHEMNEALAKAFVTPVDREDLDMLSQQLDNVCDTIEEILQKFYVYNVKQIEPAAIEFAKNLVKSCEMLVQIMNEFENFKKSKTMHSLIIACNDVEEECDKLYLTTMHNLTKNSTDVLTTISWYKIFDCFEECVDACEHVSECVGSIIMKNT